MKFLIFFALAFATVSANDLYSRLIEMPVLENEGRITNGQTATPGEFKYMVGLDFDTDPDLIWCGGSLIGETWVLTAAHCTDDTSSVMVYLGSTIRGGHEKVYNVPKTHIMPHPVWNPALSKNDIALIRIPETNASSNIGFVRIPSNNRNKFVGRSVVLTGWGETDDKFGKFSKDLKFATLEVSPGNVCFEQYALAYNDDVSICVATPNKVSSCHGDSGGPLVLKGPNVQIGVMSFGEEEGCAKGLPSVFTRVSAYRPWILERTEIH